MWAPRVQVGAIAYSWSADKEPFVPYPYVVVIAMALFAFLVTQAIAVDMPGWRPHMIRQGDGKGGWITREAQLQFLTAPPEEGAKPLAFGLGSGNATAFGLVQSDNGDVVFAGTWTLKGGPEATSIAISSDRGVTWSDLTPIPGVTGRPMNLTNLGGGTLSFVTDKRYYSHDHGVTWTDSIEHPPTGMGLPFMLEGNAWVDRDENGKAKTIYEIGWHYKPEGKHPEKDAWAFFRRSIDGGRTWLDEISPPQWKLHMPYEGRQYVRGVSEGALVRAANGNLVAALRTDLPPRYFKQRTADHYEGTGISISKDDGKTWSPINVLYDAGRMHANLLRMPNDDLVMTLTVRIDVANGELASYRRGCEAIVSRDHGVTWDLDRKYILDEWAFYDHANPHIGPCGHLYSIVLDDGSILTAHNNYLTTIASIIRWQPQP